MGKPIVGVSFAFLILVNGRILIACVKLKYVAYGSLNVFVGLHADGLCRDSLRFVTHVDF